MRYVGRLHFTLFFLPFIHIQLDSFIPKRVVVVSTVKEAHSKNISSVTSGLEGSHDGVRQSFELEHILDRISCFEVFKPLTKR